MEEVKDAHMITRSYIKAWADAQLNVDVVDIESRQVRRASIKKATTVEYAYRPDNLGHNLEEEYSRIESQGLPAIVKLRQGDDLSAVEKKRLVAFLDMHLDRGRFADQETIRTSAIAVRRDGTLSPIELNLGDRMILSQFLPEVERLRNHAIETWEWEVRAAVDLITGDGAVLLWSSDHSRTLAGVTFPLSPSQLLVVGPGLPGQPNLNRLVRDNSRRWLVGTRGQFVRTGNRATRRENSRGQ